MVLKFDYKDMKKQRHSWKNIIFTKMKSTQIDNL